MLMVAYAIAGDALGAGPSYITNVLLSGIVFALIAVAYKDFRR
jgi:hypothetical protein